MTGLLTGYLHFDLLGIAKHALKVAALFQTLRADKKIVADDQIVLAAGVAKKGDFFPADDPILRTNELDFGGFLFDCH